MLYLAGSADTGRTMGRRRERHNVGLPGEGRAAFTLFESLVAALLVGIAATAFCSALVAGTTQNQAAVQYVVATELAAALMEEVLSKPFADPDLPLAFVPGLTGGRPRGPGLTIWTIITA